MNKAVSEAWPDREQQRKYCIQILKTPQTKPYPAFVYSQFLTTKCQNKWIHFHVLQVRSINVKLPTLKANPNPNPNPHPYKQYKQLGSP